MGYVKIQERYRSLYSPGDTFFGVYSLYCPDQICQIGGIIDGMYKSGKSILDIKQYLDSTEIERKYRVPYWVGFIRHMKNRGMTTEYPRPRIIKKTTETGPYQNLTGICLRLFFKNEYNSGIRTRTFSKLDTTYSGNLDWYLRNSIIPRYLEKLETGSRYNDKEDVKVYISLYLSKKFEWI